MPQTRGNPADNVYGVLTMQIPLFALLGAVVGILLNPLVTRLAVPATDEEPSPPDEAPVAIASGEAGHARVAAFTGEGPWWRLPLLVASTVVAFALAAARYEEIGQAAVISAYAVVFIVCAVTDLISFRVPNAVTYPAAAGAVLAAALMPDGELVDALIGGVVGAGLMLVVWLVSRGGLGLGDVKLAGFAGLAVGGPLILPALLITTFAGGVAASWLAIRVRRRNHPMPYAPYISGGALVMLLWQGSAFASL